MPGIKCTAQLHRSSGGFVYQVDVCDKHAVPSTGSWFRRAVMRRPRDDNPPSRFPLSRSDIDYVDTRRAYC